MTNRLPRYSWAAAPDHANSASTSPNPRSLFIWTLPSWLHRSLGSIAAVRHRCPTGACPQSDHSVQISSARIKPFGASRRIHIWRAELTKTSIEPARTCSVCWLHPRNWTGADARVLSVRTLSGWSLARWVLHVLALGAAGCTAPMHDPVSPLGGPTVAAQ